MRVEGVIAVERPVTLHRFVAIVFDERDLCLYTIVKELVDRVPMDWSEPRRELDLLIARHVLIPKDEDTVLSE
jgi:hypothetical protein